MAMSETLTPTQDAETMLVWRMNVRTKLRIYSTCEQIAEIAGVPLSTACAWRHGSESPSLEQVATLAKALRFSIDELFIRVDYHCQCGCLVKPHEIYR